MWNFDLLSATHVVEKTMGFVLYRWVIFLAVAGGLLLATLSGAGTAIGVSSLSTDPTLFANAGAILGFAGFCWLLYKSRRVLFYNVIASHQLLLARIVAGESIPQGKTQVPFAKQALNDRFPQSGELWQIRTSIGDALSVLPAYLDLKLVNSSSPVLAKLFGWLTDRVSALNADVIVASLLAHRNLAPRTLACAEILSFAKNGRLMLNSRFFLVVFELLGWLIAYVVLLIPSQKIAGLLPFETGFWPHIFALVFSWHIKASFLEPIAQAALIQLSVGLPKAEHDEDDAVATWLTEHSEAFRRICTQVEE